MDNINLNSEKMKNLNDKFDIILQEAKNLSVKLNQKFDQVDIRFEQIDKRFEQIDKRFEQIDKRFDKIDKKFDQIDMKFDQIDQRLDSIDGRLDIHDNKFDKLETRITNLDSINREEHSKMMELITSLNSAFIRYETDGIDKIRILFDADVDRRNHQDIYGHEFQRLNDLVAKNSYRISNLEQHL